MSAKLSEKVTEAISVLIEETQRIQNLFSQEDIKRYIAFCDENPELYPWGSSLWVGVDTANSYYNLSLSQTTSTHFYFFEEASHDRQGIDIPKEYFDDPEGWLEDVVRRQKEDESLVLKTLDAKFPKDPYFLQSISILRSESEPVVEKLLVSGEVPSRSDDSTMPNGVFNYVIYRDKDGIEPYENHIATYNSEIERWELISTPRYL